MANNLGSLVVSLGLDAAEFTKGLTKVEYKAFQATENIKKGLSSLTTFAAGLSLPISAAGLLSIVNNTREAADQLKDLSDATGSSIEKISALDGIARSTGGNIEAAGSALVKFNSVLKEADGTKGAGAVLKALNLEITDLKRQDPADALREVAIALQVYADDGEKARAVQELFGKSVKDVAPFLKDLAEAKSLDARLTANQIEQLDKFNKEWAKLRATAEDASRVFSVGIISELNSIIEKFGQAEKAGKSFLSVLFLSSSEMEAKNRAAGAFGKGKLQDADEARSALKALESSPFRPADQDPRMIAARERVRQAEAALAAAGGGRGFVNPANVVPLPTLAIPAAGSDPKKPKPSGGKSSGKDPILEANEREADMLRLLADLRQKEIDLARQGSIEELAAIEKRNTAYQEWVQSLIDDTPTRKLEEQRKTMQALAEEYERGRFGAAGSADAIKLYTETVGTYLGTLDQGVKQVNATADAAGSIFGSWLQAAITDGAKLSDVINGLIRDLVRLAIQKAVIEPAANAFTGFVAGALGSYDGGGYTGMGSRSGGLDGKGGFMAMLHPNETVIDHSKGQGMGGVTVVQTFNISSNADHQAVMMLRAEARRIKEETVAAVSERANRGGSFARSVGRL